ncbi:hypothetical protein WICPIJ_001519 [Wickerhamomyces pijperi]|uniref:Uncharacterized protein n=1 Tax=Wickerhamomyces pijperi TaxID=599730 RepID=A0A9P8QAR9_WICPI|nr:hypothetical protein WICPIJ_001519 [Wickerhamomyces pijperi]
MVETTLADLLIIATNISPYLSATIFSPDFPKTTDIKTDIQDESYQQDNQEPNKRQIQSMPQNDKRVTDCPTKPEQFSPNTTGTEGFDTIGVPFQSVKQFDEKRFLVLQTLKIFWKDYSLGSILYRDKVGPTKTVSPLKLTQMCFANLDLEVVSGGHQWSAITQQCPCCNTTEKFNLYYFISEDEFQERSATLAKDMPKTSARAENHTVKFEETMEFQQHFNTAIFKEFLKLPKLTVSYLTYVKYFAAVLREASKKGQCVQKVFPFGLSLKIDNTRVKKLRMGTQTNPFSTGSDSLVITAEINGWPVAEASEFDDDQRKIHRWFESTSIEVEISFTISNNLTVEDINIERSTLITKPLGTQAPNKMKRIRLFSPETHSRVNSNGIPEPIDQSIQNLFEQCCEHATLNSTKTRFEERW